MRVTGIIIGLLKSRWCSVESNQALADHRRTPSCEKVLDLRWVCLKQRGGGQGLGCRILPFQETLPKIVFGRLLGCGRGGGS